jgi:hypothetical protein
MIHDVEETTDHRALTIGLICAPIYFYSLSPLLISLISLIEERGNTPVSPLRKKKIAMLN